MEPTPTATQLPYTQQPKKDPRPNLQQIPNSTIKNFKEGKEKKKGTGPD